MKRRTFGGVDGRRLDWEKVGKRTPEEEEEGGTRGSGDSDDMMDGTRMRAEREGRG